MKRIVVVSIGLMLISVYMCPMGGNDADRIIFTKGIDSGKMPTNS